MYYFESSGLARTWKKKKKGPETYVLKAIQKIHTNIKASQK